MTTFDETSREKLQEVLVALTTGEVTDAEALRADIIWLKTELVPVYSKSENEEERALAERLKEVLESFLGD